MADIDIPQIVHSQQQQKARRSLLENSRDILRQLAGIEGSGEHIHLSRQGSI